MVPENLVSFTQPAQMLDKGFIYLVDLMGDDKAIVDAARNSYQKGTKVVSDDRTLLRYLMRHYHTTPLEMVELKIHVRMPVFVARQWVRHRMASINEMSARYSELPGDFYVPELEDICEQSSTNKQGSGAQVSNGVAEWFSAMVDTHGKHDFLTYDEALKAGVSRELARILTPVSTYTEWTWKIDGKNLLDFIRLRYENKDFKKAHAQKQIWVYAEWLAKLVETWLPITWEAFVDYRLEAYTMSRMELVLVRELLGNALEQFGTEWVKQRSKELGMTNRELKAFLDVVKAE